MTNTSANMARARGPAISMLIVTGLSGAGKSSALNTLEDLDYYCIDNLPLPLLPALGGELLKTPDRHPRVAVGIDVRGDPQNLRRAPHLIADLRGRGFDCRILYLEASEEVLIQRFSETRRKHPLSDTAGTLPKAIHLERNLLIPLSDRADLRIDTRDIQAHQLRRLLKERFALAGRGTLSLQFQSFGFKRGVPTDADFVFDVRCLPNPHWQANLRPLTGRDQPVVRFLESAPSVTAMKDEIAAFLERWIPVFEEEGRSYLTVAIGCTGGRHRSVYMVEHLGRRFDNGERHVTIRHREGP